jgi:succinate-semialdehyde dehydrogenase/glutarate-semialdehyde dehydrogenase
MPEPTTAACVAAVGKSLFIGGAWVDPAAGGSFPVYDPATGEALCEVADAGTRDGRRALDAAVGAQQAWAATAPRQRSEILRRAYEIVLARSEDLALLMTLEMGKPLAEARGEVDYAAEFLRWFSEEAVRIDGGFAVSPDGRSRLLVMRQPVGPSLLITPWNFPLAMGARKIAPAIAAGCTMVLKPAPQTPLSSLALAEILHEAGLPAGVLSVLPTSDPGPLVEPLLRSGQIRKVSFTGSTQVGRLLLAQAAEAVVKASMELGGNAPFLVFADALTIAAKMRNMGEACTAANRIFVHESLAEEFGHRLAERMAALVVGPGTEPDVTVGPLIDDAARGKVSALVADALSRGAHTVTGGSALDRPGYFFAPTVLTGVSRDSELMRAEIFGPVAPIVSFTDEDEVVRAANDTEWGLVGYVFTENLSRALSVAERLEVGMVGLNTGLVSNPAAPFGGVKQSGLGREGGRVGIDEFLEYKYIATPSS